MGNKTLGSPAGKQSLKEPEQGLDFYFRWTNSKDTSEKLDAPHSIEKKKLSLLEIFLSNYATLNLKILCTPKVVHSRFLFKSGIDLKKLLWTSSTVVKLLKKSTLGKKQNATTD